jgi:hypothetical protein
MVDEVAVRQVFLPVLWFYPVSYHNTHAPYHLSIVVGTVGPLVARVSRDSDPPHPRIKEKTD